MVNVVEGLMQAVVDAMEGYVQAVVQIVKAFMQAVMETMPVTMEAMMVGEIHTGRGSVGIRHTAKAEECDRKECDGIFHVDMLNCPMDRRATQVRMLASEAS